MQRQSSISAGVSLENAAGSDLLSSVAPLRPRWRAPSAAPRCRYTTIDVVKRAAYRFSDRVSFDIRQENGEIICQMYPLSPMAEEEAQALLKTFRNEVLDQDLRRVIADETAPMRNAILAFAFSRTGLQN
jgi:His-Xaa-Ser system protein HxsD